MRWLLLLCLCLPHDAEAKSPPPFRLTYQDMVAARNNPIGVMNLIEVTGRYRLSQSDHILLQDAHISAGPFFDLTPAAAYLGGVVRFKPLAILQLTASHAWVGYFGTFGLVQSFDDSRIDYSDTQLDINAENDENFATTGSTTKLEAQNGIPAIPGDVAWTGSARLWLRISPLNNDSPPLECEERIETLEDLSVDQVRVFPAPGVDDGLDIASQHIKSGTQRCRIPVCSRPSGETSCSGWCKDSRSFCRSAARLTSKWCRFSSVGVIQGCRSLP